MSSSWWYCNNLFSTDSSLLCQYALCTSFSYVGGTLDRAGVILSMRNDKVIIK